MMNIIIRKECNRNCLLFLFPISILDQPNLLIFCQRDGEFLRNFNLNQQQSDESVNYQLDQSSVNDEKIRRFNLNNMVLLKNIIAKRLALGDWKDRKDYLIKMEKRKPQNMLRIFMKMVYRLYNKIKMKYVFSFKRIQKYSQDAKHKVSTAKQPLAKGLLNLVKLFDSLNIKYYGEHLKEISWGQIKKVSQQTLAINLLDNILILYSSNKCLMEGWSAIKEWDKLIDKMTILKGTINLIIHPLMRMALLYLKINVDSVCISQNQSKSNELDILSRNKFDINPKRNNEFSDRSFCESQIKFKAEKSQQQVQHDQSIQGIFSKKQNKIESEIQNFKTVQPLEFNKEIKKKFVRSTLKPSRQLQFKDKKGSVELALPRSNSKQSVQLENRILNDSQERITTNLSTITSKTLIKVNLHIPKPVLKSYRVISKLDVDVLFQIVNSSKIVHKLFHENFLPNKKLNHLKTEEIKAEFIDFNDLFSVKNIFTFHKSQSKPSLAEIKKNSSFSEEYLQRYRSSDVKKYKITVNNPSNILNTPSFYSENNINDAESKSRHSTDKHRIANASSSVRFKPSKTIQPNSETYKEKPEKTQKQMMDKKNQKVKFQNIMLANFTSTRNSKSNKKTKSKQKKIFNAVKGTNRMSSEKGSKRQIQTDSNASNAGQIKEKVEKIQLLKLCESREKQKEKREGKEDSQYCINFRRVNTKKLKSPQR